MGGSNYSKDDYDVRSSVRSSTAKDKGIDLGSATFAHDHSIKTGAIKAQVHATLKPTNAMRVSRDSAAHPVTVPIAIFLDTTGSMSSVPGIIQEKLSHLMGHFLDDKASGKRYLGEGYPAVLIGAVDDFDAMAPYTEKSDGTLQMGQFESGIEIDDNLTNLWLTRHGGGTYHESYELALYFAARHTAHDHLDKRGRKGYIFIIGDEHAYDVVKQAEVLAIMGDSIESNIPTERILQEAKEKYHVFFILPNMTQNYGDPALEKYWVHLLGQQNVIKLQDPSKICECIAAAVAICEEHVGIDDLTADLGMDASLAGALVPLSKVGHGLSRHSADGLIPVGGTVGGVERL